MMPRTSAAPSLIDTTLVKRADIADSTSDKGSLTDLMYDGFYALFMLKNRCAPKEGEAFSTKLQVFLSEVERNAKARMIAAGDIEDAKYAFCASVDEIILRSQFKIRDAWERQPLQLTLFGDQLAGENFFTRLETLRAQGIEHLQVLQVFHMCLLLGFEGRYAIEGSEKLHYLTARLGDEIAHMFGKSAAFAPHGARPDAIANTLRHDIPAWVVAAVFSSTLVAGYWGVSWSLSRTTQAAINGYSDIVKLAPRAANLTIVLP